MLQICLTKISAKPRYHTMDGNAHQHRRTDSKLIQRHPRRSAEGERPTKSGGSRLLGLEHLQSRVLRVVVDDHQTDVGGCLRFVPFTGGRVSALFVAGVNAPITEEVLSKHGVDN